MMFELFISRLLPLYHIVAIGTFEPGGWNYVYIMTHITPQES